jgi:D-serine deaminase-like pyridoxal phosphate-dependent protein
MIRIAGSPENLCPHCKTHKTPQIIQMWLQRGVKSHKCATIAEAEMLADGGVEDILLAYQLVGPNLKRMAQLIDRFPAVRFTSLVDSPAAVAALSDALSTLAAGKSMDVMLDLNSGMNRTGIQPGPEAIELYEMIESSPGLQAGGLHWYDGHHRQPDRHQRQVAVTTGWQQLGRFRNQLMMTGLPIPRVVAAGTGSFPILAEVGEPDLQLSPGTTVFHDDDMVTRFPELDLFPAQGILTRVVGNNRPGYLTLDVGHKACAADQPQGHRLFFPQLGPCQEVMHSEEHLVIETDQSDQFQLGDCLLAISRHSCPVSAVHSFAYVIENGDLVDQWDIIARNRVLTI